MLVFVNKNDNRTIVVLGTMHIGAPSELTETYKLFLKNIFKERRVILRPELCLTRLLSPYSLLLSYLFGKSINPKNKYLHYTLGKFRSDVLKTEKGRKDFDKLMKKCRVSDYTKTVKTILLEQRKKDNDNRSVMDAQLMGFSFGIGMKCMSLDDRIIFPFWRKSVKEYLKKVDMSFSDDTKVIKALKDVISFDKEKMIENLYKNTRRESNLEKLVIADRNKLWYKKLTNSKEKFQIAMVGAGHLRKTDSSLKKLFKKDEDWNVYDFKYYNSTHTKNGMSFTASDMMNFVKLKRNI